MNVVESKEGEVERCPEEEDLPTLDPTLVQVRANKAEIDRRITAFLERKRLEVNEDNQREFCIAADGGSCARTSAAFVPRIDSTSHIRIRRVHNQYGPQTRLTATADSALAGMPDSARELPRHLTATVNERLSNMETHLGISINVSKDVFSRLKMLEERILQLESLSPEYFSSIPQPEQQKLPNGRARRDYRRRGHSRNIGGYHLQSLSLTEIEERIQTLKNILTGQSVKIKQEPN